MTYIRLHKGMEDGSVIEKVDCSSEDPSSVPRTHTGSSTGILCFWSLSHYTHMNTPTIYTHIYIIKIIKINLKIKMQL